MSWVSDELRLRQGAVFRMMHEFADEGRKYRYFLVLNANPQSDKIVVLTTTTTQYQKLQAIFGKDAESILVGVHPEDYPDIERFCVVNCRACKAWEKNELLAVMRERGVEHKNPLPESILRQVIANIARDRTIPPSIKNMVVDQGDQE